MERENPPSLADQLAAAQAWWMGAGVDHAFADEATVWAPESPPEQAEQSPEALPAEAQAKAPAQPAPPSVGGDPANWPQSLEDFGEWWLSEQSLDAGGSTPRIAPRGRPGAKLMVLVPEPEAGDSDRLLSGPQGSLLSSFFTAAGLDEADVYFGSALPRHTPLADWAGLAQAGLGAVTLHHIGLARPERLLIFGRTILPLVGHNLAQSAQSLREINHQGRSIPALVARKLEVMLARPATRSNFWQRWLDSTDN